MTISMESATLEIEPYGSFLYSSASPFSFHVDKYTTGYLTSRYIVLHCIPLNQERYLALPAQISVLQATASVDGDYLCLLEKTAEEGII